MTLSRVGEDTLHRLQVRAAREGLTVDELLSQWLDADSAADSILADMKALQELYLELNHIDDLTTLYQRIIVLSRDQLGFDRIALFVLDDATNMLRGTFGIDPDGNIRDESYYHEIVSPDHWVNEILNSPSHARMWTDAPLFDNSESIDIGWKAATALWNGHRAVGYLVTDNFVSRRKPRAYEMELISILGSTFGDLIERKWAEEALRQSERRFSTVFHNSPVPMVISSPDAQQSLYLEANQAYLQLVGYTWEELSGRTITEMNVVADDDQRSERMEILMDEGHYPMKEVTIRHRSGEKRDVMIAAQRLHVEPNEYDIEILLDVTDRKRAQKQEMEMRLEQERINLLTTFIQDAAHEFRTPLSIIRTSLYLMERRPDPENRRRRIEQIESEVQRLARLVDMQLKMAKLETRTPSMKPVNIGDLVKTAHALFSARTGVQMLQAEVESNLPIVQANTDDLLEAIMILLDNAHRFSPADSLITISAAHADDQIRISVADQGVGIPDDVHAQIFGTFWRSDQAHTTPGLGLGLPIARKIVELHGGRIEVKSAVGQGSTFTIILPTGDDANL